MPNEISGYPSARCFALSMTIRANPAKNRPECYNFSVATPTHLRRNAARRPRPARSRARWSIEEPERASLARAQPDDRDLPQPASGARLRDRDPLSRVHVRLPQDRTARLRRDPHQLRPRRSLHRVEGAEVLHDRLPQPRHLLRGGHQPDPRRSRRRLRAAADDGGRRFLGAGRDYDDGDGDVREGTRGKGQGKRQKAEGRKFSGRFGGQRSAGRRCAPRCVSSASQNSATSACCSRTF